MPADLIEFPALAFTQGTVFVCDNLEQFTTATKAGVLNGFFDGMIVIDGQGHRFDVAGATIDRRLGLLSRQYRVGPVVSSARQAPDVDELRAIVLSAMTHPRWTSVVGVEKLEEAVRASTSVLEIIHALGRD